MPRKTQIRVKTRCKRGNKSRTNSKSRSSKRNTFKYRGRGGCENGSCLTTNGPEWKGGSISKDMYDYTTDKTFYLNASI